MVWLAWYVCAASVVGGIVAARGAGVLGALALSLGAPLFGILGIHVLGGLATPPPGWRTAARAVGVGALAAAGWLLAWKLRG